MVFFKCTKCNEVTNHLIIFKGKIQFWECQNCGDSDTPVLETVNVKGL